MPQKREQYVQYGCGLSAPQEWRNFDASLTLRFERLPLLGKMYIKNAVRFPPNAEYADIVKGLPVVKGSCAAVYCSHVLEHLSLEDARTALTNTYELLAADGVFRLVVPDLEVMVSGYLQNTDVGAAQAFVRDTGMGRETRKRGVLGFIYEFLGNSSHLWCWDYKSLEHELLEVGFKSVRRARFNDSGEKMFIHVEDKERWDDCLGIECIK